MGSKLVHRALLVAFLGALALALPPRTVATPVFSCAEGCVWPCNPQSMEDVCDALCPGWYAGSCWGDEDCSPMAAYRCEGGPA
jgi:hypothetical protein